MKQNEDKVQYQVADTVKNYPDVASFVIGYYTDAIVN